MINRKLQKRDRFTTIFFWKKRDLLSYGILHIFCVLLVVTHKGFHATIVLGLYNKSWKQSHGNDKQCVIGKIQK